MATNAKLLTDPPSDSQRSWYMFAIKAFAAIVARKHNIPVPLEDLDALSDEELAARLRTIQELAHLPPV